MFDRLPGSQAFPEIMFFVVGRWSMLVSCSTDAIWLQATVWQHSWQCVGVLIVDEFVPLEKTFMLWIVCSKSTSVNGAKADGWRRTRLIMTLSVLVNVKFFDQKLPAKSQNTGIVVCWSTCKLGHGIGCVVYKQRQSSNTASSCFSPWSWSRPWWTSSTQVCQKNTQKRMKMKKTGCVRARRGTTTSSTTSTRTSSRWWTTTNIWWWISADDWWCCQARSRKLCNFTNGNTTEDVWSRRCQTFRWTIIQSSQVCEVWSSCWWLNEPQAITYWNVQSKFWRWHCC